MMKILIGYDGSDSADAALHDLQRAGLPLAGSFLTAQRTSRSSGLALVREARQARST